MKAKLKFIIPIPILLVVLAAAYMFVLAPKKAPAKPPKVERPSSSASNAVALASSPAPPNSSGYLRPR